MITADRPIRNNLAGLRTAAGLTQAELARAIGVRQHSISNFETRKHGISDRTKARICAYLKCSISDLICFPDPAKK